MDNDIFGTRERRDDVSKKEKEAELGATESEKAIIEHIRKRIAARGARGI
jgi:hypothetical protein